MGCERERLLLLHTSEELVIVVINYKANVARYDAEQVASRDVAKDCKCRQQRGRSTKPWRC